jgi:hypothetical protein
MITVMDRDQITAEVAARLVAGQLSMVRLRSPLVAS